MKIAHSLFPVVLATVVMAGCKPSEGESERTESAPDMAGAWRASIHLQSGQFSAIKDLEFMYVFNDGGTMIESSNYDAAPPVPPAYGVWRKTSSNQYQAEYEFFMSRVPDTSDHVPDGSGWLPAGRGIISETIHVSEDGKSFSSSVQYRVVDRSGKQTLDHGEGTGEGTRMGF